MTPGTTVVSGEHGTMELDLTALADWGRRFGASLTAPALVVLSGDLGSGKTTLVQAICRGCGVRESVTSPTFAIVHWYKGTRWPVFHLDLYRLESPADLTNVGWDDVLAAHAVVLVEWPERAGDAMPATHVVIRLEHVDGAPELRRLSW